MYEKTDAGYNMYMRIPLFMHTYKRNKPNQNSNILFVDVNRLHFNIYEPLSDNMSLQYDYMVYRKGTYLQGLSIKHKDKTEINIDLSTFVNHLVNKLFSVLFTNIIYPNFFEYFPTISLNKDLK